MDKVVISQDNYIQLVKQVSELHGALYRNGFRDDIKNLKQTTKDLAQAITEVKGCLDLQALKEETAQEFWSKQLKKVRTWAAIVAFIGINNLGDIIRTVQNFGN